MEISQKTINGEKIVNTQWKFERILSEIRLTEYEREELNNIFDDLIDLANELNI